MSDKVESSQESEYDPIVSPFLDWIANSNPAINARAELATEKQYGPQWSNNSEAQLWFNDFRRALVQDTLAAAIGLGDDQEYKVWGSDPYHQEGPQASSEGEPDASTQEGAQAPDEEEEEETETETEEEEVDDDVAFP